MASKPVQISLDEKLLKVIDRDPETKRNGRSSFVRAAVTHYLKAKRAREIDQEFIRAYKGKAKEAYEEIKDLIEAQAWPED